MGVVVKLLEPGCVVKGYTNKLDIQRKHSIVNKGNCICNFLEQKKNKHTHTTDSSYCTRVVYLQKKVECCFSFVLLITQCSFCLNSPLFLYSFFLTQLLKIFQLKFHDFQSMPPVSYFQKTPFNSTFPLTSKQATRMTIMATVATAF